MHKIMLARVNNARGVSLDLLKELVRTYDPAVLKARLIFGHTKCGQLSELESMGTVEGIELEDGILYGFVKLTNKGVKLIQDGAAVYVSVSFTCLVVGDDDDLDFLPAVANPEMAVPLGDGTWGVGCQVDESGDLIGGTGIYLNHVALLGGSDPAIPGQPTLQEQISGGLNGNI